MSTIIVQWYVSCFTCLPCPFTITNTFSYHLSCVYTKKSMRIQDALIYLKSCCGCIMEYMINFLKGRTDFYVKWAHLLTKFLHAISMIKDTCMHYSILFTTELQLISMANCASEILIIGMHMVHTLLAKVSGSALHNSNLH